MNPSRAERLWRTLPDVRARERPRFLFFAGLATVVSLAQTIGLAGSEALFLAEFGAGRLPLTFVGAALFTVAGSMAYAMRVGSARNDDLFVQMLTGAGIVLALATVAVAGGATWVLPLLFCFFYLSQAVFVNHLWTFCGDYFDTIASKRVLPLLTVGASVGGVLGGLFAAFATDLVGPAGLVAAWGVLLLAAALIVRLGRRNLRRWGPLELEEADETSVEGIRSATRYLRASTLGRWLVLSASGMMLALFIAQYLYSGIFAERFQTSAELAAFFGLFLAITNLIEIAIEIGLTPLLIRRLGVPTANLVHPLFTIATFAGLAFHYGFATGIAARMNKELLENALAAPVRALVYNAIPMRFRGRTRAFVEGIVVYAGMAAAGLVLLVLGDPDPLWLGIAGGAAALLYLIANLRSRREYLRTLVKELRAGRIDLQDLGDEIGNFEVSRLAELWQALLRAETAEATRPLLALVPTLAARGVIEPLLRAASHPRPDVRRVCVEAIARWRGDAAEATLRGALDDPDATIRLAALKGLAGLGTDPARLLPDLRARLSDLDPLVRARAAALAGDEGDEVLRAMIAASDPARATAALDAAPDRLIPEAGARADDANPTVRAAALACLARIAPDPPRELHEILHLLGRYQR